MMDTQEHPPASPAAGDPAAAPQERRVTAAVYGTTLRASVADTGEQGLMLAYDLARLALAQDVQLTEIMEFHFAAARALAAEGRHTQHCRDQTEMFLVEFLSVYDMALRGYRSTVPRLMREIAHRQQIEAKLAAQRDTLDQLVADRTRDVVRKTEALDKTLEHLRQTNREQAEFTYAISHDLKSPSNTIALLGSELEIALGPQLDDDAAELLSLIRKTAARMGTMIEDILAYARCLDHQVPDDRIDLNGVFVELLEDLRFDITQSDAEITVDDMPTIFGEPMQVKLLFQNLVSNALKFRQADRTPRVTVRSEVTRDGVDVTVRDNGIGISPEHFDRIFELFQRRYTLDAYPGSGIGLALCKRIATNLGGTIRLTSQPGSGSAFTVSLRRAVP